MIFQECIHHKGTWLSPLSKFGVFLLELSWHLRIFFFQILIDFPITKESTINFFIKLELYLVRILDPHKLYKQFFDNKAHSWYFFFVFSWNQNYFFFLDNFLYFLWNFNNLGEFNPLFNVFHVFFNNNDHIFKVWLSSHIRVKGF